MAYFFENLTALASLNFKVPKDNPLPMGWAKKLPLRAMGESEAALPFYKQAVATKFYSITRDEFEALSSTGAEDDEDDEDESDL